jgi:hypothetical protein
LSGGELIKLPEGRGEGADQAPGRETHGEGGGADSKRELGVYDS